MKIIKVFTNYDGNFGNPVGIVVDKNKKIEVIHGHGSQIYTNFIDSATIELGGNTSR